MITSIGVRQRRIAICGAGGHGRVVADVVTRSAGARRMHGFFDDRPELAGRRVAGYPVLGRIQDALRDALRDGVDFQLILGIGGNRARERLARIAEEAGFTFATAVHPSAQIGADVVIGPGTVVMANAAVNVGARIGLHVIVNTGATVDHDCAIDDFVHVSPGAHLAGGVAVARGAHIGIGACAIPGVRIGPWSVVGAGATVINDIPEGATVVGTPALPIRAEGSQT